MFLLLFSLMSQPLCAGTTEVIEVSLQLPSSTALSRDLPESIQKKVQEVTETFRSNPPLVRQAQSNPATWKKIKKAVDIIQDLSSISGGGLLIVGTGLQNPTMTACSTGIIGAGLGLSFIQDFTRQIFDITRKVSRFDGICKFLDTASLAVSSAGLCMLAAAPSSNKGGLMATAGLLVSNLVLTARLLKYGVNKTYENEHTFRNVVFRVTLSRGSQTIGVVLLTAASLSPQLAYLFNPSLYLLGAGGIVGSLDQLPDNLRCNDPSKEAIVETQNVGEQVI